MGRRSRAHDTRIMADDHALAKPDGETNAVPLVAATSSQPKQIPKSKIARWRAAVLIILNLLMIAHIVQWRMMGETVSPIEPAEAMYTLQRGAINAGLIFFSLALLTTLVAGRFFCGWACHMGSLQDLCTWLLGKLGLKPKLFRSRLLVWIPVLAGLYMFVWPTVLRYFTKPKAEPLIPQFTNQLITTEFWATFPPVAVAIPFLFICGFMTVYFLGSKGFCTFACPYGGFYSIIDKLSLGKIRVTDDCDQCGHCTAVCTSNVRVHTEVKRFGMVVDPNCHRGMDCISVCPQDALYFGFGKPAIAGPGPNRLKQAYSLTWPEEILGAVVFFASLLAIWNAYQLVPMLMALGIALVTTYLVLRTFRLLQVSDLSFYRYSLKTSGRVTKVGWAFLAFAALWTGLNAHSGWIHYNERAGANAFESIRVPDELALAEADPRQWLAAADLKSIEDGRTYFDRAAASSLFVNKESISKRAWLEYLSGDATRAVDLLAASADRLTGRERALILHYRGSILNRLGRPEEALADLVQALSERPDLSVAREEKGEALWRLGQKQAAVEEWNSAIRSNESLVLAHLMLAGAAAAAGDAQKADGHQRDAAGKTPNDPYFHWMLGLRLNNLGMKDLANAHFQQSIRLDPKFRSRKNPALTDNRNT